MNSLAATGDIFTSVGGVLTGIAEILGLVGAGVGFLIRSRRGARRERLRTEAAASLAATEAKKQLEAKLERQNSELIQQYEDRLDEMEKSYARTIEQYQQQVADLISSREVLLKQILESAKPKPKEQNDG